MNKHENYYYPFEYVNFHRYVYQLKSIGKFNVIPVHADEHGLNPQNLRKALNGWNPSDAADPKSNIPKLLYCTPNCANPTGISTPLDRKKEIYSIAKDYNLLILEDDAYFYLQFSKVDGFKSKSNKEVYLHRHHSIRITIQLFEKVDQYLFLYHTYTFYC